MGTAQHWGMVFVVGGLVFGVVVLAPRSWWHMVHPVTVHAVLSVQVATTDVAYGKPLARDTAFRVVGAPTITAALIDQVLAAYHSPASGTGQVLYRLGVAADIDPVYALAFFWHESGFGTQGVARVSRSLGNLRCIPSARCQDGYAWFATWEQGFAAWYDLIRTLYVQAWGCVTVAQIIPRYAPSADHNDVAAYIQAVERAVQTWRTGQVAVV